MKSSENEKIFEKGHHYSNDDLLILELIDNQMVRIQWRELLLRIILSRLQQFRVQRHF